MTSPMDKFRLDGRGVVVTGGGGYLGRAMAHALADAGAVVAVLGRTAKTLEETVALARATSGSVVAVVGSVGDESACRAAIAAVEGAGAPLHGWVNNAYGGVNEPLGSLTPEGIAKSLEGGVGQAARAADIAANHLQASGAGGSIVHVASMYGLVSPQPDAYASAPAFHNPPIYGAAKAALCQLARYGAVHLAPHGIRVNTLTPGPFPHGRAREHEAFVADLRRRVPLGRMGEAEEIGPAAVFLLSDASSYVTGHNLVVDGGWTAW